MHSPEDRSSIIEMLEDGRTPWPRRPPLEVLVDDDAMLELLSGRRTCWPVFDDLDLAGREGIPAPGITEGDLLAFRAAGPEVSDTVELRMVTHVWAHDGIAPGWAIASLRPVKLVTTT